jgi:hypothetical protein
MQHDMLTEDELNTQLAHAAESMLEHSKHHIELALLLLATQARRVNPEAKYVALSHSDGGDWMRVGYLHTGPQQMPIDVLDDEEYELGHRLTGVHPEPWIKYCVNANGTPGKLPSVFGVYLDIDKVLSELSPLGRRHEQLADAAAVDRFLAEPADADERLDLDEFAYTSEDFGRNVQSLVARANAQHLFGADVHVALHQIVTDGEAQWLITADTSADRTTPRVATALLLRDRDLISDPDATGIPAARDSLLTVARRVQLIAGHAQA